MTYERFDIVVLPFPFSDRLERKNRPALVLSGSDFNGNAAHVVTAMITSAKNSAWPLDVAIQDFDEAGLPVPCFVRMKFFTASEALVARRAGHLTLRDQQAVRRSLQLLLSK